MGNETVKQLRDDPSVSSVNAVESYRGGGIRNRTLSLMEAFSSYNEYMVIMDPRSGMDVWTHAKRTKVRIKKNGPKDGGPFEGATDFYDDGLKMYSGYFDPETAKRIENDENVSESKHKPAQ
ncbi:unnamed protein product [Clonostachys rhizophaga]|uniref:Uncharacterized protein n=1 Tax=Clonostachys rhizophaga TaxID=160324 RepID=A0A9N9VLU7_9HYPO|nr:unnamed protein product [Clonostachys rhizophaga]